MGEQATRRHVTDEEFAAAWRDMNHVRIMHKAFRKFGRGLEPHVQESLAAEALWSVLRFYDEAHPRRAKFTTLLFRRLRQRLTTYSERALKAAEKAEATPAKEGERLALLEAERPRHPAAAEQVSLVLADLPPGFRRLLVRHYLDGATLMDIALEEGQSPDFISRKLQSALAVARLAAADLLAAHAEPCME